MDLWIQQAPENQQQFDQFAWVWQQGKRIAAAGTVDTDAAWEHFKKLRQQTYPANTINLQSYNRRRWLSAAAAILVLLATATGLWWMQLKDASPGLVQVSTKTRPQTDTLPDGSVVTLNKESQLTYPSSFKGKERNVSLKGEAFFKVTPDRKKPFLIQVNDVQVKVLGTSFNVQQRDNLTIIIVETGVVQVTHAGQTVTLNAGEKVEIDKSGSTLEVVPNKELLHQYYRTKVFVCDNTSLKDLVTTLNDAYEVNIVIANPELAAMPLTTTFNNESLDTILDIIAQTFDLSVKKQGSTITLQ